MIAFLPLVCLVSKIFFTLILALVWLPCWPRRLHDSFDFNAPTAYQNRGPMYRRDGKFVRGAHQPVWFGEPVLFSPRDTGNSFYTSCTILNGQTVLWFGDQKFYLFGKRL